MNSSRLMFAVKSAPSSMPTARPFSWARKATRDLKLTSQMLGHSSTAITEQVYTSVFEDVEREAAESAAALVPRAHREPISTNVPTACPPVGRAGAGGPVSKDETAGHDRWGG